MALREKFGRLVLLEETDSSPLGNEYRAARLGPSGFERLVSVLRFSPAVSAHPEASKRLVEEARLAAQIQNPGLVRVLGVGRVGASFYLSTEPVEGRTLRAILDRCRAEGFPFGADHALMVASRAAAGLEPLHARKDDAGRALLHGLLSPRQLVVAFDGEVKLKGLGLWSALGDSGLVSPEERGYLAPEQATARGDARSDVYALGLVLLEALGGQAPDAGDPLERIASARVAGAPGEAGPLPRPLAELLRRALAKDPAARFPGMAEMRKAIDLLLFSGDFTPTTFDLAFFMHTLFRDEVERDTRAADDARAGDYREFLADEAAKPAAPSPARTEPVDERVPAPDVAAALAASPTPAPPLTLPEPPGPEDAAAEPAPKPASSQAQEASALRPAARASREAAAREAASRLSLGGAPAPRAGISRSLGLVLGLVAAVVVGGGAGWLYFVAQRQQASASIEPSAEQAAADTRVRELEARIAQLEREKAEAETRAADEARRTVEQQAAARGRPVDPEAIARAQEEARQRTRAEQERRQQQELQRLADEKQAEERRRAAATPAPLVATPAAATPAPTPTPTPTPVVTAIAAPPAPIGELAPPAGASSGAAAPGPSQEPAVQPPATTLPAPVTPAPAGAAGGAPVTPAGRLAPADPTDPAVRPPAVISEELVPYPRQAPARISTAVVVRALVDETGKVVEASVGQPSGLPAAYGFEEAALKRVRSRKYRPARRHDVPVPIWVVVRVEFRPPPPARP